MSAHDAEDTPPEGRPTSFHDISTAPARPNGNGSGHPPDDGYGPTLTTEEYQRHLVGKIGVLYRAVEKAEKASEVHGKKADAATSAARDAKIAAEAIGRTVEDHMRGVNSTFLAVARTLESQQKRGDDRHAEVLAAIAPIVESSSEWSGAKKVAGRIWVGLGVIGGVVAGALTAYAHLKGH